MGRFSSQIGYQRSELFLSPSLIFIARMLSKPVRIAPTSHSRYRQGVGMMAHVDKCGMVNEWPMRAGDVLD